MASDLQFTMPKLLLVEGRDEVGFFTGLLRHLNSEGVQVIDYAGKDSLSRRLPAYVREPSFAQIQSVAIVRDADANADAARQSVFGSLQRAGLPDPPGDESRKVSVFIMPDNFGPGALEDLCLAALRDDPAIGCVDDFLECAAAAGYAPPQYPSKARLRALLAAREDSEARLGIVAQRSGYLNWNHAAFQPLADFLRNL